MEIHIGDWRIRSWSFEDKPAIVKYANNRKVWLNLRDNFPHPYTDSDADTYLQSVVDQHPETDFAIATQEEAIGGIALKVKEDVSRKSAELGYWLGEPFWGKGIATAAVGAIVEYGFSQFDIVRIWAEVFEWNPASICVLEKAGFQLEGRLRKSVYKDGKIIDKYIYAILKSPGESTL